MFFGRYWKQLPYTLPIWILFISYTIFEIFDFIVSRIWPWPLTFNLQKSSEVENKPDIQDPIQDFLSDFYWHFPRSPTVFEIFDFERLRVWPWPLNFKGNLGSKKFLLFESPYFTSCLTSNATFAVYLVPFSRYSTAKFLPFDLDHWP